MISKKSRFELNRLPPSRKRLKKRKRNSDCSPFYSTIKAVGSASVEASNIIKLNTHASIATSNFMSLLQQRRAVSSRINDISDTRRRSKRLCELKSDDLKDSCYKSLDENVYAISTKNSSLRDYETFQESDREAPLNMDGYAAKKSSSVTTFMSQLIERRRLRQNFDAKLLLRPVNAEATASCDTIIPNNVIESMNWLETMKKLKSITELEMQAKLEKGTRRLKYAQIFSYSSKSEAPKPIDIQIGTTLWRRFLEGWFIGQVSEIGHLIAKTNETQAPAICVVYNVSSLSVCEVLSGNATNTLLQADPQQLLFFKNQQINLNCKDVALNASEISKSLHTELGHQQTRNLQQTEDSEGWSEKQISNLCDAVEYHVLPSTKKYWQQVSGCVGKNAKACVEKLREINSSQAIVVKKRGASPNLAPSNPPGGEITAGNSDLFHRHSGCMTRVDSLAKKKGPKRLYQIQEQLERQEWMSESENLLFGHELESAQMPMKMEFGSKDISNPTNKLQKSRRLSEGIERNNDDDLELAFRQASMSHQSRKLQFYSFSYNTYAKLRLAQKQKNQIRAKIPGENVKSNFTLSSKKSCESTTTTTKSPRIFDNPKESLNLDELDELRSMCEGLHRREVLAANRDLYESEAEYSESENAVLFDVKSDS